MRPSSPQRETPLFCFRYADRATKNAWAFPGPGSDSEEVLRFLSEVGRSTWGEIAGAMTGTIRRHRKHHEMPIAQIEGAAQQDLAQHRLDEIFGDEIYRFRVTGEKRLWGFRAERTFHVVWWDPEHRVYPSEKN
jgi:hypothetical protein